MHARLLLVLKGFCMGIADVIPGVSGGTMALILGIYRRVVDSIGRVGLATLRAVFAGAFWKRLFRLLPHPEEEGKDEIDVQAGGVAFLAVLFVGLIAAALIGVKVIPALMTEYRSPTFGFFFGLVLASVVVPYRMMKRRSWREALAFALAAVGTFFLVGLRVDDSSNARGTISVSTRTPTGEALTLPTAETRFSTFRHGGNIKREILLLADIETPEIVVPGDGSELVLGVVAQMPGEDGNLPAGEVTHLAQPSLEGVTVRQPAPLSGGQDPALWFVFLAGAIAICAMILPGISGSFILLLLGQYFYVVYTVHELVYSRDLSRLTVFAVFLAGIVIGILAFSRLLSWLLSRYQSLVMAVLVGLMLGSLRKIWPFQAVTASGATNELPGVLDGTVITTTLAFLVGFAIVIALNLVGQRRVDDGLTS